MTSEFVLEAQVLGHFVTFVENEFHKHADFKQVVVDFFGFTVDEAESYIVHMTPSVVVGQVLDKTASGSDQAGTIDKQWTQRLDAVSASARQDAGMGARKETNCFIDVHRQSPVVIDETKPTTPRQANATTDVTKNFATVVNTTNAN